VTSFKTSKAIETQTKNSSTYPITSGSILSMDLVAIVSLTVESAVSDHIFSIYLQKKDDLMKTLHAVRRVQ